MSGEAEPTSAPSNIPWTGIAAIVIVGAVAAGGYFLTREEPTPPPPPLPEITAEPHALAARDSGVTTVLPDGSLLLTGGPGPADRFTPGAGWKAEPNAADLPPGHGAAVLPDGRLFIAGGVRNLTKQKEAAFLDLGSGKLTPVRPMPFGVTGHTVTAWKAGHIFVAGGNPMQTTDDEEPSRKAWVYEEAKDDWRVTFDSPEPKVDHVARALDDGHVLLAGGRGSRFALVYDESIDEWKATARSAGTQVSATALLSDGRVLIMREGDYEPPAKAEIYDPAAGTWKEAGTLSHGGVPTVASCPDGSAVAVYAPSDPPPEEGAEKPPPLPAALIERLDLASNEWRTVGKLSPAPSLPGRAVGLPDGTIVLLDGSRASAITLACDQLTPMPAPARPVEKE